MTDEPNVRPPTPEELEELRAMMPPTRPLVVGPERYASYMRCPLWTNRPDSSHVHDGLCAPTLASAMRGVFRPDGDAVTETGASDAAADG